MKKHHVEPSLKALVLRDEVAEHCENIAVIAGLLAAGDDAAESEPALTSRAGNLILNETRELDETLKKLYKHWPKPQP